MQTTLGFYILYHIFFCENISSFQLLKAIPRHVWGLTEKKDKYISKGK